MRSRRSRPAPMHARLPGAIAGGAYRCEAVVETRESCVVRCLLVQTTLDTPGDWDGADGVTVAGPVAGPAAGPVAGGAYRCEAVVETREPCVVRCLLVQTALDAPGNRESADWVTVAGPAAGPMFPASATAQQQMSSCRFSNIPPFPSQERPAACSLLVDMRPPSRHSSRFWTCLARWRATFSGAFRLRGDTRPPRAARWRSAPPEPPVQRRGRGRLNRARAPRRCARHRLRHVDGEGTLNRSSGSFAPSDCSSGGKRR